MSEDIDELLYTQEDINEWIRACDELQEVLLDKREEIKNIQSQLDQQKAMWNELKEWVKLQIDGLNEQLVDYDFDSDCRDISIDNFEIMLQQMRELEGEDEI